MQFSENLSSTERWIIGSWVTAFCLRHWKHPRIKVPGIDRVMMEESLWRDDQYMAVKPILYDKSIFPQRYLQVESRLHLRRMLVCTEIFVEMYFCHQEWVFLLLNKYSWVFLPTVSSEHWTYIICQSDWQNVEVSLNDSDSSQTIGHIKRH